MNDAGRMDRRTAPFGSANGEYRMQIGIIGAGKIGR
jgi:hypothetical protein